jgi:hypothetical protein
MTAHDFFSPTLNRTGDMMMPPIRSENDEIAVFVAERAVPMTTVIYVSVDF